MNDNRARLEELLSSGLRGAANDVWRGEMTVAGFLASYLNACGVKAGDKQPWTCGECAAGYHADCKTERGIPMGGDLCACHHELDAWPVDPRDVRLRLRRALGLCERCGNLIPEAVPTQDAAKLIGVSRFSVRRFATGGNVKLSTFLKIKDWLDRREGR